MTTQKDWFYYCYSNTKGKNWNNNILTHTVTVSHLGDLSKCQAWFRGSFTHLQSRTIITEAEPQRPTLLSSQFYLGESLNSKTVFWWYGKHRHNLLISLLSQPPWCESHTALFRLPELTAKRKFVSQLEQQLEKDQGGHLGRSSCTHCTRVNLLKPKVWIIPIIVHTPGYALLIECLQWQGTHHYPQSSLVHFG